MTSLNLISDLCFEFVEIAEETDFTKRFKQPFGSGGPPRYFIQLCLLVQRKYPDFKPADFSTIAVEQETEETKKADALVKSIVDRVHKHVITVLKETYGIADFFDRGIPQKAIKMSATEKYYEDKDSMPKEVYLNVIELKQIIEHKQNWPVFKDTMDIQLPSDDKGQAKYLKWLDRLNEVRRIPFHPYGRSYKTEQVEFLEFIHKQLATRNI